MILTFDTAAGLKNAKTYRKNMYADVEMFKVLYTDFKKNESVQHIIALSKTDAKPMQDVVDELLVPLLKNLKDLDLNILYHNRQLIAKKKIPKTFLTTKSTRAELMRVAFEEEGDDEIWNPAVLCLMEDDDLLNLLYKHGHQKGFVW